MEDSDARPAPRGVGRDQPSVKYVNRSDSPSPNAQEGTLVGVKSTAKRVGHKRLKAKTLLHLFHRVLIIVMAAGYVVTSFAASWTAVLLLRSHDNPWNAPEDDTLPLMVSYLGTSTIRESPLVQNVLQNATTSLSASIYLQDAASAKFTMCDSIPSTVEDVFGNTFMRSIYAAITDGTSYTITELAPTQIELIAPIVDCQASALALEYVTTGKFFFLVRQRLDHDKLSVLVVYLSVQQFKSNAQNGAAAVGTIQLVSDMRDTTLRDKTHYIVSLGYPYKHFQFRKYDLVNMTDEGLISLRLVRQPGKRETTRTIDTSCRVGFYIKGESEQSNVNNYQWDIESRAVDVVARWRWVSKPVLHDSWGWVHGIQFFIGWILLSSLVIVCITTYRNFLTGHHWIGDAYVSISSIQLLVSAAVAISWYMNEFWSLREFAISTALEFTGLQQVKLYEWHMRADLLTLHLGSCGLTGRLLRERIDPVLAVLVFLIAFEFRVAILKAMPASVQDPVTAYANELYALNVNPRLPGQDKISPMGLWSTFPLPSTPFTFLLRSLSAQFVSQTAMIVYAIVRKIHRHFYPDKVRVQRDTTGTATSENEHSLISQKRVLTLFEIATGANLESRFGVLSDFETCVFIKATKHASADGVFSTGFVIANKKFLLQARDYWRVVFMKLLGRRVWNVYVYEVSGTSVKQTACLVYPHTLTVVDLLYIDVRALQ